MKRQTTLSWNTICFVLLRHLSTAEKTIKRIKQIKVKEFVPYCELSKEWKKVSHNENEQKKKNFNN